MGAVGIPDSLFHLSARQHGLIGVAQAAAEGVSRAARRHAVATGRLELVSDRVLRVPGVPMSDRQRVMVAVLDTSRPAYACWSTGAALWGVPGHRLLPAHVVRAAGRSGRRRTDLAVLHEMAGLDRRHVTVVHDIPCVRPEVLVLQFCASTHPARAASVLDNLWRRRLLSGPSTRATLDDLARSGRAGVQVLRELLDKRGDDYVPPASNLERRFMAVMERAGEPPMRPQVDSGGEHWVGRVDFRDDRLPLVVEVQSETYHSALVDKEHDERRLAALRDAGLEVVEVTDEQVWHRPDEVLASVRSARRRILAAAA
jgi:hypothetical protein